MTATSYHVAFPSNALPLRKGKERMDPSFANGLDGFSTMGPILFYMEGLKEAHEKHNKEESQQTGAPARLCGTSDIEWSTSNQSIAFLVADLRNLVIMWCYTSFPNEEWGTKKDLAEWTLLFKFFAKIAPARKISGESLD